MDTISQNDDPDLSFIKDGHVSNILGLFSDKTKRDQARDDDSPNSAHKKIIIKTQRLKKHSSAHEIQKPKLKHELSSSLNDLRPKKTYALQATEYQADFASTNSSAEKLSRDLKSGFGGVRLKSQKSRPSLFENELFQNMRKKYPSGESLVIHPDPQTSITDRSESSQPKPSHKQSISYTIRSRLGLGRLSVNDLKAKAESSGNESILQAWRRMKKDFNSKDMKNTVTQSKVERNAAIIIQRFYRLYRMRVHFDRMLISVTGKSIHALPNLQTGDIYPVKVDQGAVSSPLKLYSSERNLQSPLKSPLSAATYSETQADTSVQQPAPSNNHQKQLMFQTSNQNLSLRNTLKSPNLFSNRSSVVVHGSRSEFDQMIKMEQRKTIDIGTDTLSSSINFLPTKSLTINPRLYRKRINQFNINCKEAISALISDGYLAGDPNSIADFLLLERRLNKEKIGEYLGIGEDFNIKVLHHFVNGINFTELEFDVALRHLLKQFRLPGEAQKIDRIMKEFARWYCIQNPEMFASTDTAYILAFSVIMLNTDAHNPNVKKKMSLKDFIRNNRGIDNGQDLPKEFLSSIYNNIINSEIQMNEMENIELSKQVFTKLDKKIEGIDPENHLFIKQFNCREIRDPNRTIKPTRRNNRSLFIFDKFILITKPKKHKYASSTKSASTEAINNDTFRYNTSVSGNIHQARNDLVNDDLKITNTNRLKNHMSSTSLTEYSRARTVHGKFNVLKYHTFEKLKVLRFPDSNPIKNAVELVNTSGRFFCCKFESPSEQQEFVEIMDELIEVKIDTDQLVRGWATDLTLKKSKVFKQYMEERYAQHNVCASTAEIQTEMASREEKVVDRQYCETQPYIPPYYAKLGGLEASRMVLLRRIFVTLPLRSLITNEVNSKKRKHDSNDQISQPNSTINHQKSYQTNSTPHALSKRRLENCPDSTGPREVIGSDLLGENDQISNQQQLPLAPQDPWLEKLRVFSGTWFPAL